jgi:MFS-type transporter involved in bile tolerance (Atg22 family)
VVLGIWWFIFQQKRPGPKIPKGSSYATIGFKQIWLAIREIRSLPQTFLYFFAYFLLADGLNTTGQLPGSAYAALTDFDRYSCDDYPE